MRQQALVWPPGSGSREALCRGHGHTATYRARVITTSISSANTYLQRITGMRAGGDWPLLIYPAPAPAAPAWGGRATRWTTRRLHAGCEGVVARGELMPPPPLLLLLLLVEAEGGGVGVDGAWSSRGVHLAVRRAGDVLFACGRLLAVVGEVPVWSSHWASGASRASSPIKAAWKAERRFAW